MTTTQGLSLEDRDGLKAPFEMLHHVALITSDMEKTVSFYRDVLGSEIAMAHRLNRPDNVRHYFITVAPNTVFAFFEFPDAQQHDLREATVHKTDRMLDHICFFVDSPEKLDGWHARVTAAGVPVHGYVPGSNLFFPDPNNIIFQVSVGKPGPMGFPIHDDPEPAY
jgi:catechol 2,3-dioxygenase-like lactoylglutathione lyase family enzyme